MAQFAKFALRTNLILAVCASETFGLYECETLYLPARRRVFISRALFVRPTKRISMTGSGNRSPRSPINTPVSARGRGIRSLLIRIGMAEPSYKGIASGPSTTVPPIMTVVSNAP